MSRSSEENITRTTLYLPKYLHAKAIESKVNMSKEFTRYLETVLYGTGTLDIQHQYESMCDREKALQIEIASVQTRITELKSMLDSHDAKLSVEEDLYQKFIKHVHARITNSIEGNIPLDPLKLYHYWKSDFFSNNGFRKDMVEKVIGLVDAGRFDFESFEKMRRGDVLESDKA